MIRVRIPWKNTFIYIYERKYVQENSDTGKENRRYQALSGAAARTGSLIKKERYKVYKKRRCGVFETNKKKQSKSQNDENRNVRIQVVEYRKDNGIYVIIEVCKR